MPALRPCFHCSPIGLFYSACQGKSWFFAPAASGQQQEFCRRNFVHAFLPICFSLPNMRGAVHDCGKSYWVSSGGCA
jgi:hypothetical protein